MLTSCATYTARHGPKVQWNWLAQRRKDQHTAGKKPTKTQIDKLLVNTDPKAPLKFCAEAMEKYLFNKLYNQGSGFGTEKQGR